MLRSKSVSRTEAALEPVTPSQVAKSLLIEFNDLDDLLKRSTTGSRRNIENRLTQALITQTCVDKFDRFAFQLELHWGPVSSVTTVTYIDADGVQQTVSSSIYKLRTINGRGVIELDHNQTWPTPRGDTDGIVATYVAGYGTTADDVPESIRDAIVARAIWLYRDRGEDTAEPPAVEDLLSGLGSAQVTA